jgi:hypothetical protein
MAQPSIQTGFMVPATAAAVSDFKRKQQPQILNFEGRIDNIVGIKTMAALDKGMLEKRGGLRLNFKVDDPTLPRDIFVLFDGTPPGTTPGARNKAGEDRFSNTFNTEAYLKTHQPVAPIIFFGGRGVADRSREAADEVLKSRQRTEVGATVIVGISGGGFAALKCASLLSGRVKLTYVAINDGAFFAKENDILSFKPLVIRLPGPIIADEKDNFFQTFGNEVLVDSRGPGGFMDGTEFHGKLDGGFRNKRQGLRTIVLQAAFQTTLKAAAVAAGGPLGGIAAIFAPESVEKLVPLLLRKPVAVKAHVAGVADATPQIEAKKKSIFKP